MIRCMGCMAELDEEQTVCPYCGYQKGTGVKEAYYLLPGKILGQKYIVGKVLGYGGFGVTYIGWDAKLGRKVAIKEYLPSDFATRSYGEKKLTVFSGDAATQFQAGLESFLSEAKRLARFNQIPEIVDIYDCFMENDTGYIIMEFLEGETVKQILKREGKLSFEEARKIMIPVLSGLGQVHKEGIIHRDIAPDNIFIQKDGKVRILDFGAARYATAIRSRSLSVILKPGYAPEEQYRSHGNQGPWTDVYGAGATFYRMITGIRPKESIERMMEDTLKTPTELGIQIPQSVENALMNSLNIKAENRIQDAEVFCRVLKEQEDMLRVREEKKQEVSGKLPLWIKGLSAAATVLVAAVVLLAVTGGLSLTKKEVRNEGTAPLAEGESYVPDVSGMSYEEAENILKDMGLKLVINGMNYSETIEKDKILSQEPYGGGIVNTGDTLYVVMSGGDQEVMMPDLIGMEKEEAVNLVKAQGLSIKDSDVSEEYSDVVEKGRIVSQSVEADQRIPAGTKVSMVVSMGSLAEETAVLTVPDLTGMTKKEAIDCLKRLKEEEGFTYTLGSIEKEYSTEVEKGRIICQSIPAGSQARTDQTIALVISQGPEFAVMPNVVYTRQEEAVAALEAAGFQTEIITQYSSQVAKGCVISQSEEADSQVAKGTTIILVISLGEKTVPNNTTGDTSGENTSPTGPPADTMPEPPAQEPDDDITVTSSDDDITVTPSDDDITVTPAD